MSIYLRNKSYYYDFVYKHQRYTGCIGPISRTVAKEEESRKKAEVIEGRLNPAKVRKVPRFDAFAKEYLDWLGANCKPLTVQRCKGTLKSLKRFFDSKLLSEITAWDMERYKKERKEAGLQPGTINLELSMLKAMLNKAVIWKKLTDHPGKEVKALKLEKKPPRFLSEEEEASLLAACVPALRRIIEAGILTGFRRQELVTLRPEEVDFTRKTVSVAACYSKNGESRTIPIGERLKALLQEALAVRGDNPTVFSTRVGIPWTRWGLTSAFQRVARSAGLGTIGPHVLRHTFGSRLVMAGVDLRTVQELMGHKDIKMTLRYAHLSIAHKQQAIAALESHFPEKSPTNSHNTPHETSPVDLQKVVSLR